MKGNNLSIPSVLLYTGGLPGSSVEAGVKVAVLGLAELTFERLNALKIRRSQL